MKYFIEKLEGTVQVNFNPARCLFDALSRVIRSPTFYKTHPEYA